MVKLLLAIFIFITTNSYALCLATGSSAWLYLFWGVSVLYGLIPSLFSKKLLSKRLQLGQSGCMQLETFLLATLLTLIFQALGMIGVLPRLTGVMVDGKLWLWNGIIAVLILNALFWSGIIRIYVSSTQLGLRWRVIGVLCGMIPIVNLVVLFQLLKLVRQEVQFENEKLLTDEARKEQQICKTKYPILMVHGVFFRDLDYFNYWGRIPEALERNGANIYYGNHESASSVEDSARQLSRRILDILEEEGCEKVNIIAHSKGGLDCRYAISKLGMAPYVASLTTINTPHRGCEFADFVLHKMPEKEKEKIANAYNTTLHKLGDKNPDFIAAVTDLTASACKARNEEVKDAQGVYYQSVGSCLKNPVSGRFPLNLTNLFVKYFDGKNDGLVGEESFPWGSEYTFVENKGLRGISHGDMIDLNRENIAGFDVREFFVQLVAKLAKNHF